MKGPQAVIVVKTLREQRLREALQRSARAVRQHEQRLQQARRLRTRLLERQSALQRHRAGFSGPASDLLACDAALLATTLLVDTASATAHRRQAELRQAQAEHALQRQRWHAAQEGLRMATEHWRLQRRRQETLRTAALEEDVAETHASTLLGVRTGAEPNTGPDAGAAWREGAR